MMHPIRTQEILGPSPSYYIVYCDCGWMGGGRYGTREEAARVGDDHAETE